MEENGEYADERPQEKGLGLRTKHGVGHGPQYEKQKKVQNGQTYASLFYFSFLKEGLIENNKERVPLLVPGVFLPLLERTRRREKTKRVPSIFKLARWERSQLASFCFVRSSPLGARLEAKNQPVSPILLIITQSPTRTLTLTHTTTGHI
jgi:hypothetical protein